MSKMPTIVQMRLLPRMSVSLYWGETSHTRFGASGNFTWCVSRERAEAPFRKPCPLPYTRGRLDPLLLRSFDA